MRKPTIAEAMAAKLGRPATNEELKAEVCRILVDVHVELAEKGRLPHQRKR